MISPRMTRRRFLAAGLLGGASCLLGKAAVAPSGGFALRYLLGSSLYGNLPLTAVLAEMNRADVRALDLWARVHGTQREEAEALGHDRLLALLQSHRVRVPVTTRYDLGPFQLDAEIPFLRRLEGEIIVTGSRGPAGLAGAPLRAAVKNFVELLKPQLAAAGEAGLTLAIENHGDALIESPDSLRWLAEYSQGLPLGIALAPYHLPQDAAMLGSLIRDLGPKLVLFYALAARSRLHEADAGGRGNPAAARPGRP
ncbi:MAG: hypothetical protein WDM96_16125 [Lacunisphaera sp.]